MSISTPSACSPEIKRRPTVQAAFTIPTATTIPIRTGRRLRASALIASTTDPVSHGKASAPACAPTASRTEAATEILYGARNPRRRTKVLRLLGAVVFTFSGYAPFSIRLSSARTRSTACSTRLRFAGELSQPLAPEGWGRGIATTPPASSYRLPTHSLTVGIPSRRRAARPPTVTTRRGRRIASSHSRQKEERGCSPRGGVGAAPAPGGPARMLGGEGRQQ